MNWLKKLSGNSSPKANCSPVSSADQATSTSTEQAPLPPNKPAIFLSPACKSPFSKLGDLPLMPRDLEWPTRKDKPQSFLGPIDLSEITQARDLILPRLISGKLSVEELDILFPPNMKDSEPTESSDQFELDYA